MDEARLGTGAPGEVGPLPFVAVRVHVTREGSWHAALVYRSDETRLFHQIELAFHNHLRWLECKFAQGVWVRVAAEDEGARIALQNLVALCRLVGERYAVEREDVPYGTTYAGGLFGLGDGVWRGDARRESGLTCATFVLALFESVAWPLVERASWPDDPARCALWREEVVATLRRHGFSEQAERVRGDAACVRFLPTEVAGACLWPLPEVAFARAREGAAQVERVAAAVRG